MKHYSYPSIPQFHQLLSDIRHQARFIGVDPDTNKPRYDNNKRLPHVIKEEAETMEKNGLTNKDITFRGNTIIREFYMKQIGEW